MKVPNVDQLLVFKKRGGDVMSLADLKKEFTFEPAGTNQYYSLNADNFTAFQQTDTHSALNLTQRAPFDDVGSTLLDGPAAEKTVVLGLEPDVSFPHPNDPKKKEYVYGTAVAHPDLLEALAAELADMQQEAKDAGKRLTIILRYASEMNDTKLPLSGMVSGYKATFAAIREIFRRKAPTVPFSFSPALRADLSLANITPFWPGNRLVDVVAGTWYIGDPPVQRAAAIKLMTDYFTANKAAGKPFALSELGGCTKNGTGNDAVLKDMLAQLAAMRQHGVSFKYVTIFLEEKYGTDATLRFLSANA
jgi:hypothetical protein